MAHASAIMLNIDLIVLGISDFLERVSVVFSLKKHHLLTKILHIFSHFSIKHVVCTQWKRLETPLMSIHNIFLGKK